MIVTITDKERVNKFIKLLPEQNVDDFLNYSLFNARYTQEEITFINKYLDDCDKIFFQFNDNVLDKFKKIFDKSFKELMNFVAHSFFMTSSGVYMLYPDFKNSLDTKELNVWHKKLKEVEGLADVVWDNYKNLLKRMKKYLEEVEQSSGKSSINIQNNSGNVNLNSPGSQQSVNISKNDLAPEVLEILKDLQKAIAKKDNKETSKLLDKLKNGAEAVFWSVVANGVSAVIKNL